MVPVIRTVLSTSKSLSAVLKSARARRDGVSPVLFGKGSIFEYGYSGQTGVLSLAEKGARDRKSVV